MHMQVNPFVGQPPELLCLCFWKGALAAIKLIGMSSIVLTRLSASRAECDAIDGPN
jgi:hypothetical protein